MSLSSLIFMSRSTCFRSLKARKSLPSGTDGGLLRKRKWSRACATPPESATSTTGHSPITASRMDCRVPGPPCTTRSTRGTRRRRAYSRSRAKRNLISVPQALSAREPSSTIRKCVWCGSRLAPKRSFFFWLVISMRWPRQPSMCSRSSNEPHAVIPTTVTRSSNEASARPTRRITPVSVPPVTIQAFVACAALARPCEKV
mmetsp:Transcript_32967/g.72429  ORF Transcript_32967/g.72429 Transcript_32967/m.72429 type:complete len:201 (+) Transcript_32967:1016-1618(+)